MERTIAVFDYLDRAVIRHELWICANADLTADEQHVWNMEVCTLREERDKAAVWVNWHTRTRKPKTRIAKA